MTRSLSLYLDILRPLAALLVLLSHISLSQIGGNLHTFSNAGHQAVNVFFVLSGFVIAHVCATRERTLKDYALARAARIYSVAIPALIITFILDVIGMHMRSTVYSEGYQSFSPFLMLRSIFFLGEQWGAHRYPGSNSPYWSLGYEVWYYVAFGAYVFSGWLAAVAVLLFIGPKVAIMFPLWLLGVAVYRVCERWKFAKSVAWLCLVVPIFLMAIYETIPLSYSHAFMPLTGDRLLSLVQDYFIGMMFAVHLIGFAMLSDSCARWLEAFAKPIRWIAGATFSLYLMHLPIMHFLVAIAPGQLSVTVLVALTLLGCLIFAQYTERQKNVWKKMLNKL